jgi:hypothetical protein
MMTDFVIRERGLKTFPWTTVLRKKDPALKATILCCQSD